MENWIRQRSLLRIWRRLCSERLLANEYLRLREMQRKKKVLKKKVAPSAYVTMPYYYPTEQADIVKKIRLKRKKKS
jgi:hypothetical protein